MVPIIIHYSSFSVEPAVTAVVNATAPTPNIRLRITDANGTDITGTRIGEPLYFRIEIDEDSKLCVLSSTKSKPFYSFFIEKLQRTVSKIFSPHLTVGEMRTKYSYVILTL